MRRLPWIRLSALGLLVAPDGHLTVFYSKHNGPDLFYRRSIQPESVHAWGPEQTVSTNTKGKGRSFGYTYRIRGTFLPDWKARDLFRDVTQRCWLSVHVPEAAKPGVYRGPIRFEPDGTK